MERNLSPVAHRPPLWNKEFGVAIGDTFLLDFQHDPRVSLSRMLLALSLDSKTWLFFEAFAKAIPGRNGMKNQLNWAPLPGWSLLSLRLRDRPTAVNDIGATATVLSHASLVWQQNYSQRSTYPPPPSRHHHQH